jgi:hypothetical protein
LLSLISDAVSKQRRKDLELCKLYAANPEFRQSLKESLMRILALQEKHKSA